MAPAGRAARGLGWAAVPAAVAALCYANTLGHGFALDDVRLVRDNPALRSVAAVPRLFLEPYWPEREAGLYRPVTVASLAVNRWLVGPEPAGFHAVNLALHAAVCVLAWLVARRASTLYGTALATAVLFAAHPLHVEVVANIAGRAELLATLGVLAAWVAHRRAVDSTRAGARWGWAAAAALAWGAALLSKEHTILAPALFLADDVLRRGRRAAPREPMRTAAAAWILYVVALAACVAGRVAALGGLGGAGTVAFLDNPPAFLGLPVRLGTALWVQARYVGLFVWPARLCSDYSFDAIPSVRSLADPRLLVGLSGAAALVTLVAWGWRRSRPLALGGATWIVFSLPTANLLFPTGTIMAERLAYLPSFGACLVAGHLAAWLGNAERSPLARWPRARTAIPVALVAAVTLALGARAVARNPVWRDNASLALHDVRVSPRSAKLQLGAGLVLHEQRQPEAAEAAFRAAIEIWPDYAQARFNLGQLLMQKGADEEAIEQLERAASLAPENPRPYKSLAPLLERRGERARAIEAYREGSRLDPADLGLRFNHGRALLAEGRAVEAHEVLERLAADAPRSTPALLGRALLFEAAGDEAQALAAYREAARRSDLPADVRRRVEARLSAAGIEPGR